MKNNLLFVIMVFGLLNQTYAQSVPEFGKATNEAVINAMTLEEKARLLVGMGMTMPGLAIDSLNNAKDITTPSGPVIGTTQAKVPGAAGTTASFDRLGIPTIVVADGPAGLRISPTRPGDTKTYYATAFPIATLLASSWDTELIYKVGQSIGSEAKEYGVDIILGPSLNIHRNALGGRNFEYYSEDPFLSGKIASAMVRGIQSNAVGASLKHFAVNNFETNRNTVNVIVSERALREIYLRGFEIAVREANPWTVMTSYNKINGPYTSESTDLLRKVLRDDWDFGGFVMTDWYGGSNAVEQMKAGNNLLMPGIPKQMADIIEGVKSGQMEEAVLDENVNEMLNIVQKTGSFATNQSSNQPNLIANAETAKKAASEGMILLKNNNEALPLGKNQTISMFGIYSYDLISGGTGSGDVNEAYTISLPQGLVDAGYRLNEKLKTLYEAYLLEEKAKQPNNRSFFEPALIIPELTLTREFIEEQTNADLAIITIGRISGEFADRKKENDYFLSRTEKELIQNISDIFHAKGKMVTVVLNIGGVIETASWKNMVDAILLTWLPGQEAGRAIADILDGNINPSGKLATTFLKNYDDNPASLHFPGKEYGEEIDLGFAKVRMMESNYTEGIYVGYRAFDEENIEPSFEFGHGLSYTKFAYNDLKLSDSLFNKKIIVNVGVENIGKYAGKEVVQLYLSAPDKTMDKPVQELKGFKKTRVLKPGESQILTFDLDDRSLASFDEKNSTWAAEKGTYIIKIGSSSRKIKLESKFVLEENLNVERVNKALSIK